MPGIESQGQALQPEKFKIPPLGPKEEGDLGDGQEKKGSAKIYPFLRPDEPKKKENSEEGFHYQDLELISKGEVRATFYRGFPTKVIFKGAGAYEIVEKKPSGEKRHFFENIDEIKIG